MDVSQGNRPPLKLRIEQLSSIPTSSEAILAGKPHKGERLMRRRGVRARDAQLGAARLGKSRPACLALIPMARGLCGLPARGRPGHGGIG
jgi:hypothetical protein